MNTVHTQIEGEGNEQMKGRPDELSYICDEMQSWWEPVGEKQSMFGKSGGSVPPLLLIAT